jgi:hypothetical protein
MVTSPKARAAIASAVIIVGGTVVGGFTLWPSSAHPRVKTGTYLIDRPILVNARESITLASIEVRPGHEVVARVAYQNVGKATIGFGCMGVSDPAADTLVPADGRTIRSEETYCSTHPNASWTLHSGGKFTSYAKFTVPAGFPQPITFNWYPGADQRIQGSVGKIYLSQGAVAPG